MTDFFIGGTIFIVLACLALYTDDVTEWIYNRKNKHQIVPNMESENKWAKELERIKTQYVEVEKKSYYLCFGKPETAYNNVMLAEKPSAIQRFFLRKLLNLYYKEEVVKTLIPKP